jgi:hypothetical protein
MLNRAKADAESEGKLPKDFGDTLLRDEPTDDEIHGMLEKRRREGVKDDDIRWWWNMPALERQMMLQTDRIVRLSSYIKFTKEGMTGKEAGAEVRKFFPNFGDPDDPKYPSGEDRLLPFELKNRVDNWAGREHDSFAAKMAGTSSMNALIRSEIRSGRL